MSTRLADDHRNAATIAERLATVPGVSVRPGDTNIVVADLAPDRPEAATVVAAAREQGVLILPFGPRTIRAVTHLDVSAPDCEHAAHILAGLLG